MNEEKGLTRRKAISGAAGAGIGVVALALGGGALIEASRPQSYTSGGGGGAVSSVSNSDGTLTISPVTGAVIASLNVGHANIWSALQTFGNNISIGGATFNISSLTTGQIIQFNGTNWVNVSSSSVGAVTSVSNSDGSLTISPTTGAVIASLNTGHANSWTANQTIVSAALIVGSASLIINSQTGLFTTTILGGNQTASFNLAIPILTASDTIATLGTVQTFTADKTFPDVNLTGYLQLAGIAQPTAPAQFNVRIYGGVIAGHTRPTYEDFDGLPITIARDNFVIVQNTSGASMGRGAAVYVTGFDVTDQVPTVSLARANVFATAHCIGIMMQTTLNNGFGYSMLHGLISGIDTSTYTVGDNLWLSPTTAGRVTNVRPVWPGLVQDIGTVLAVAVNGQVLVEVAGFVGQLDSGTIQTGFVIGASASSAAALLTTGLTATRSFTFPDLTGQLATENFTNVFTALQTFGNNISIGGAPFNITALTTGQFIQYNGTNWVNVTLAAAPTTFRQISNQTTTSGTITTSTNLQFSALASTVYYLDAWVYSSDSTGANTEFGIVAPSGATGTWAFEIFNIATGVFAGRISNTFNTPLNPPLGGSTSSQPVHLTATVHVSSTPGTVGIGFATASGVGTMTLATDSMMVVYSGV